MSAPRLLPSLVLALLVGCTPPPLGALHVTVHLPEATATGVTRVTLTLQGEDLAPRSVELTPTAGTWNGVMESLPAGAHRTLQAQAFTTEATPSHEGYLDDVTVTAGAMGLVTLTLQTRTAPPPPAPPPPVTTGGAEVTVDFNTAPRLVGLTSSQSFLDVGQATALSVSATDAEGDALTYQWSATCEGRFAEARAARTTFTPSALSPVACNNCQLRVTVSDGRGAFSTGGVALCVTRSAPWQTGQWRVAGSLLTSRDQYPATVLDNGQVLVAGGKRFFNTVGAAELYDPATHNWKATAPLLTERYGHTSTLLPDGRVLVAGGFNVGTLPYAELYDPTTGTWSRTGSLRTPREAHAAVALRDGRVLVLGGYYNMTGYLASAELYDPATGTWSPTGAMSTPRYAPQATRLADGRVLVTAGGQQDSFVKTAEVYDPSTGTWSLTGSLRTPRRNHTSTLLPTGQVLVTGGYTDAEPLLTTELYDPSTGTWRDAAPVDAPGGGRFAVVLPTGKLLLAGGGLPSRSYQKEARVYDPATDTWSFTVPMNVGRVNAQALRLPTGQILVVGGSETGLTPSTEVHFPALPR